MLPATVGWQRYRAAIKSANTPYCHSPVKTPPPVRTGDGEVLSEATQQVHRRRRLRRMVGNSLHLYLELPLRPLFTNSGSHSGCLPGARAEKPGAFSRTERPTLQPLPLLSILGGHRGRRPRARFIASLPSVIVLLPDNHADTAVALARCPSPLATPRRVLPR